MSHIPERDPLDFLPFACGLTDEDIRGILKLVRTHTDEKIIEIRSVRKHAEVTTGFLADGEAGSGRSFKCVRTADGWTIKESGEWIA